MSLDVIVTGTGRCGSSFTAKILEERFGVCMGHGISKNSTRYHKVGHWERGSVKASKLKYQSPGPLIEDKYRILCNRLNDFHSYPECTADLLGVKAGIFSQLTVQQWINIIDTFNTKLVVWPWRHPGAVLYSMLYKYNFHNKESLVLEKFSFVEKSLERMAALYSSAIINVVRIDFNLERTEDEIVSVLSPYMVELRRRKNGHYKTRSQS